MRPNLISLAMLPARLTLGVASFLLRQGASLATELLERRAPESHDWEAPAPAPAGPFDAPTRPDVAAEATRPPTREPEHVSEEPVVVADFADPGAEGGAGVELHIAEPWDGYRQMKANEIIGRIAHASAAEVGVVQLYESGHRQRKTVIAAAARRLKELNRPGG